MGTSELQGKLWGNNAKDWADVQESVAIPLYEAVLKKTGVSIGTAVLDIGCGSGIFCEMAAKPGAKVYGLDASAELLEIARKRMPFGDFMAGEMEELPYDDNTFDLVTGFSSFQFAANPVKALQEALRVSRNGIIVIAVFEKPEKSESTDYIKAMGALIPPPPPGTPGPFALSADGALEALAQKAGLIPGHVETVFCPFEYPDEKTALRGLLSSGPAIRAIQVNGEEVVRRAILNTLLPYKTSAGGYHMSNYFRYMITQVG